jgi:hypothetical protein
MPSLRFKTGFGAWKLDILKQMDKLKQVWTAAEACIRYSTWLLHEVIRGMYYKHILIII